MNMCKRAKNGFTLVEVMICIVLGTFAILSMGTLFDSSFLLASANRQHLYAMNALREELEVLRDTPYNTVEGYGASSTFTNTQLAKLHSGTGTRTIANAFSSSQIEKITLTVSWTLSSGLTKTESLTTYLTRIGLNRS